MGDTKVIFLSAVSDEFHKTESKYSQSFRSYRTELAYGFRRLGPEYVVVVQEDFAQGLGDLLETLDLEVGKCKSTLVIHLVGDLAGVQPKPASIRKLKERHPTLLLNEPELAAMLTAPPEPSFTQWELYLAFEHRRGRLVFLAEASAPRSPHIEQLANRDEQKTSQKIHCERWKSTGEHYEYFADQKDLTIKAVTAAVRFGLGPAGGIGNNARSSIKLVFAEAAAMAREILSAIKNPDRRAMPAPEAAGVAEFLHAIDTVALRRELDRRGVLQVIDEYCNKTRNEVEKDSSSENLSELAFAELASGHFREAMQAAQKAAEVAAEDLLIQPDDENRREVAINSYLLLHDALRQANDHESAIAALQNAG